LSLGSGLVEKTSFMDYEFEIWKGFSLH
jgi:hypothetical protein